MTHLPNREMLIVFVFGFLGCFLCSSLVNIVHISPIFSSAIIGLTFTLSIIFARRSTNYSLAVFTGTFAGMGVISQTGEILLLSALSGLIILIFHALSYYKNPTYALAGFGGRLGFFGFLSFILFSTLMPRELSEASLDWLGLTFYLLETLTIYLGAKTTEIIRRAFPSDTAHYNVIASSIVGLAGALFLLTNINHANDIASALFLGSFIGMSNLAFFQIRFLVLSSIVATITFNFLLLYFDGFGGLLGSSALCGVITSRLVGKIINNK